MFIINGKDLINLKMFISLLTATALMPSAVSLPALAEGTAETNMLVAPNLEERVSEGLDNYSRCLEILKKASEVSKEDTLSRWEEYLSEYYDFFAALESVDEAKNKIAGSANTPSPLYHDDEDEDDTDKPSDSTEYNGLGHGEIPKDQVSDIMYSAVKAAMPEKNWEEMDQNGGTYHLYFIDGNIIVVTEYIIEICEGETKTIKDIAILKDESSQQIYDAIDEVNDFLKAIDHLIEMYTSDDIGGCIEEAVKDGVTGAITDVGTHVGIAALLYPAKKTVQRLYDVFFAMNERNRELAEIEAEMTSMGLWNVESEDEDIPHKPDSSEGLGSNGSGSITNDSSITLSKLVYNLTSGDDTYHIYDQEKPVYAIISESGQGQSGNDTISFEYGVNPDDVQFIRINGSLYINDIEHEVYVMVSANFDDEGKRIENIRFKDGTVLSFDDVCEIADIQIGTELDDTITGFAQVNYIFGLEGNDTVYGDSSTDYLFGFDGDDTLTLSTRALGKLFGEGGNNFAYGMEGNDTIRLGNGDDFIWAGKGDDIIESGSGNDIIYYELGDGNDYIDDTTGRGTYPESGYDIIYFGEGILPDEVYVTLSEDNYDFILHITKSGETVTLPGNQISGITPVFPIEEIHFMDGTTWDRDALLEKARFIYGTDDDDTLTARVSTGVTFYGYDGNDIMYGVDGNDVFYGGKGDDTMRGGNGNDVFCYNLGDGNDLIDMGNGTGSRPQGGQNILQFGKDINPEDVIIERSYDDYSYTLWIEPTHEFVTMTGNVISGITNLFPIREIHFENGTGWDVDYLESNHIKRIYGTDGDDSINDSSDNDIVYCGKGNDYIRGKGGDDRYIYQIGDGCDTIQDISIWGNGYNTLEFGEGITINDLYQESSEYNNGKYTCFYVKNRNSYVQFQGINEIAFSDGSVYGLDSALEAIAPANEMPVAFVSEYNGIIYHVYDDYAEVHGYSNNVKAEIEIQGYIDDVPVTKIEGNAFKNCELIKTLTIPNSIMYIGTNAFEKCNGLDIVYFIGSENEFQYIDISTGNDDLTNANIYYLLQSVIPVLYVSGDINADGEFNLADIVTLQKCLLGTTNTVHTDWQLADLCKDYEINVFDLCVLKELLLSKKYE